MKKLKVESFGSIDALVKFVNKKCLEKSDIQFTGLDIDLKYKLLYWSHEKDKENVL